MPDLSVVSVVPVVSVVSVVPAVPAVPAVPSLPSIKFYPSQISYFSPCFLSIHPLKITTHRRIVHKIVEK